METCEESIAAQSVADRFSDELLNLLSRSDSQVTPTEIRKVNSAHLQTIDEVEDENLVLMRRASSENNLSSVFQEELLPIPSEHRAFYLKR